MTQEVGYIEARNMPTEVRRWWLEEMMKERETPEDRPLNDSVRTRTVDVK